VLNGSESQYRKLFSKLIQLSNIGLLTSGILHTAKQKSFMKPVTDSTLEIIYYF